ncbi:hypothetical protein HOD75_02940 [archaeon]|jgi:hypothetical protein|nr:hypothetical protein [Candidatus Woesearchaeota archaeon]MBT4135617.1 hypothetical protein [archaeon]MBT4241830.1 hypothetical protein [archaeon]MBT4418378.1 hypothetical protein [archaeon]
MYPFTHFLFAFFIGEILVKYNIFNHQIALITALIATLIDIDHFIYYGIKHKDWNLKHAWNGAVYKKEPERTFIHHKLGFILITLIIIATYFINPIISYILAIAYYSHMFLDYIPQIFITPQKTIKTKEAGFRINIALYEIIFIILLIIGIIFLIL